MKKMLEYQRLDIELNKLKKSSLNSEDRANLAKLKNYIVESHNKGFQLEDSAKDLLSDYQQLKAQYDSNCDKVQKLIETDINTIELDKVDSFLSQINNLSSELFLLERNIGIIMNKIKASLKDFDTTKKNMIKAKEKYSECKEKCDNELASITPKLKEIEGKMASLEKEIPADIFNRYKTIKADKVFPVYVALSDGHCSGCRVEIPTSKVNKLKESGSIVCEQCHRIIYNQ